MPDPVIKEKEEPILVKVSPAIGVMIDQLCGGKTKGGRGNRGGRSWWVLGLIHEKLAVEPPEGYSQTEDDIDLHGVDLSKLDRKSQIVATCWQNGLDLDHIVEFLVMNRIPTSRGGAWTKQRVRNMLSKAVKKLEITRARTRAQVPVRKVQKKKG